MINLHAALMSGFATLLLAGSLSANQLPLPVLSEPVDLQRYAGTWHVQGSIPLRIPFFSDADAVNYSESYQLNEDGSITMICRFEDAGEEFKQRQFEFRGQAVNDPTLATWKVQVAWPLRFTYRIIHLDADYGTTIVATPNRRYGWIMSRQKQLDDDRYNDLLEVAAKAGYKIDAFRRVPQT